MVTEEIYWFGVGGYEGALAKVWVELCKVSNNILEIGGNVGLYSVLGGLATRGEYTVLEPVPSIARALAQNLRLNKVENVSLQVAAAIPYSSPQQVSLNLPNEGRAIPVGAHLIGVSEVSGRSSHDIIEVAGLPFCEIARGKDLIKIDAEGIEAGLLAAGWDVITAELPALVIEVLPEAEKLAALIRRLVSELGYQIQIVPAYGSDRIVSVEGALFRSTTPATHNSKDVVLTRQSMSLCSLIMKCGLPGSTLLDS